MIPDPLHPAVVHFPVVFAVLLPAAAIIALFLIGRGGAARRTWALPALLGTVLAATSFVAVRTGEAQEERVEQVVAEAPLHGHEESAERFLLLSAIVAGVGLIGLARGNAGAAARWVATAGSLVVLVAGYQVGRSGGELVYEHGAAAAYVEADGPGDGAIAVVEDGPGAAGAKEEERYEGD